VTDATVCAMEALGARRTRIAAAIGPCIAQGSYEVDDAFFARFLASETKSPTRSCRAKSRHAGPAQGVSTSLDTSGDLGNARFFKPGREGHAWFDLEGYVAMRLAAAGVGPVEPLGLDTYADETRFYSYRRATHRGEPGYGREIAVIGLRV
jgi:copper oxidase (laccase) domain-containing protein